MWQRRHDLVPLTGGKQLEDGVKFCTECGTAQGTSTNTTVYICSRYGSKKQYKSSLIKGAANGIKNMFS